MIYKIFVSHAWKDSYLYKDLISIFNNNMDFIYEDYSIPEDSPFFSKNSNQHLEKFLESRISSSNCFILIISHNVKRFWVMKELAIAQKLNKPIVLLYEKIVSYHVESLAVPGPIIVNWNDYEIIETIKSLSVD